ncbi:DUF421 domain-containing protein [Oceanobacillus sp. CAU 1775]
MNSYLGMFTDLIFGFLCLFALTKILGKTQISQITAFDFISALILGELIGNALFDENIGLPQIGFVVVVWGSLMYFTELITQKFKRTRYFLEGNPAIVIYNGKLIRDEMKKNKLDVNQLQHMLRAKDVFSLEEVEFAFLETNGTISVMKKSDFQTPTRKDMKLAAKTNYLPITLVNDGEIIYDNLKEKNLTEEWLIEELKKQDYNDVSEVFHVEYQKDRDILVFPYLNRNHQKWDS